MPKSTTSVASVEQNVPQPPVEQSSNEDLMKQIEEMKKTIAKKNSLILTQTVKLDAIEKQREKMPLKLYKIHRKIYREWYNTIEARTVDEAKEIANSTSLNDLFKNWKRVNSSSVSYKKKTDPVINMKTGEPYRTKKEVDNSNNKKDDNKNKKVKSNNKKKKNTKNK